MPQVFAAAASVISYVTAASAAAAAGTATLAQTLTVIGANVALAAGANIVSGLLQPNVSSSGQAATWTADPNAPLHFAAGRVGVAGQIVYRAAYGPNDRMYQSLISVVSAAGPIDGWESFKADDIAVTFDGSGKANSSYYANVMWRQTRLGAQPDTALTSPSGLEGGATLPSWGSSYKLSGKASYILTLAENSKRSAYQGREPQPMNVFRGLKVYDPRLDSTYPGGSGTHRLNNPATWTYSNNPILWGLKWSLGLWEDTTGKGAPQVGQQVGGIGSPIGSIDVASFIEAANIADANGWTTAAWPSTDDDKAQVLDAFLQAGGAYYIERAGKIACLHRAAPRASVATISAQDTAGPLEIDTTASRIQRKNAIVPSIWSEADGWQITAIEEVSAPEWVAEDGNRKRSEGVTFPYVTNASQAAQLACLQIAHTREGISGRIPLKPYMQGIEPGDCFTITEPGFVLDGLKCLCLETSYDAATGVHTVTFVSETDGKYPYALGQTQTPPGPPTLTPVDPTIVQGPGTGDWVVTVPGPAPDGTQLPTIDLTGYVTNENADAMLIAWRAVVEGEDPEVPPDFTDEDGVILPGWVDAGTFAPTTRQLSITGMQPGAVIWLAIRYKRGANVSLAQRYGPITVGTLVAQPNDSTPDTDPPAAPTGLTAEGSVRSIFLEWVNPSDSDLAQVQIFRNTTNNSGTATQIATAAASPSVGGFFVDADPDLPIGSTRYYWIKAVDRWGNVSVDFSNVANAAARGTNVTDFASTVRPIELFPNDTAAGTPTLGRVYFNTTTFRLRRGTGSAWTDAVPSTTITGQLTDSQLEEISAAKLTGQITSTQVSDGAISTPKLAAGSVSTAKLAAGAVVADTIAAGAITTAKLDAGAVTTAKLAAGAVTANEILANTITGGQIAAGAISTTELAAGAVTTNILGALQVTAEKIAAGAITTTKLAAGSVTANEISVSNLSAIAADLGTVTSGLLKNAASTAGYNATLGVQIGFAGSLMYVNGSGSAGGFGASSDLLLWFGPTPSGASLTDPKLSTLTKAGANVYISTTAPRFGGSDVPTGGPGDVDVNTGGFVFKSAVFGGDWTSTSFVDAVTLTLTGIANGASADVTITELVGSASGAGSVQLRIVNGSGTVLAGPVTRLIGGEIEDVLFTGLAVSGSSYTAKLQIARSGAAATVNLGGRFAVTAMAAATTTQAGLMTATQASQLASLVAGGGGGSSSWNTLTDRPTGLLGADGSTGYISYNRGDANYPGWIGFHTLDGTRRGWIGRDAGSNDRLTISGDNGWPIYLTSRPSFAGNTPYDTGNLGAATTSAAGLMSAADKTKLNGVATGATANSAESASATNGTLVLRTNVAGNAGSIVVTDVMAARNATTGALFLGSNASHYLYNNGTNMIMTKPVTAPSFTPTSDLALKENLTVDLDDEQAVIAICQIARAEWDSTEDGVHRMGVVAQALSDVDPRWVTGGEVVDAPAPDQLSPPVWDEDAEVWRQPLRVDPMAMLASAFAAIRALANENGALERRVTALEAALSSET